MKSPCSLSDALAERILILDGAHGTFLQSHQLTEAQFRGIPFEDTVRYPRDLRHNHDILSLTQADLVADMHAAYFAAGADVAICNTFNASLFGQHEFFHFEAQAQRNQDYFERVLANESLGHIVHDMNVVAVRLARQSAQAAQESDGKPRYVIGSMGPMAMSASMSADVLDPAARVVSFDQLRRVYRHQALALIEAGVDAIILETIFDTLNAKAAIFALEELKAEREVPRLMLSFTIADKAGRTLSGQTVEAFWNSIRHARPLSVGINCALGAEFMLPYLRELSSIADCAISLYPNAGLPDALGCCAYKDDAQNMARVLATYAQQGLLNLVGGCCGSTPTHIKTIAQAVQSYAPRRIPVLQPRLRLAGLDAYNHHRGCNTLFVGERCNVAGSALFARLIRAGDFEPALAIARRQVEEGALVLDLCFDDGLLESPEQMRHFVHLLAAEPDIARVPLMLDSAHWSVLEAGLRCMQGKGIVNSLSLKKGEEDFLRKARLIRAYGAALVLMCFDEKGMAEGVESRLDMVTRMHDLLVHQVGFEESDLIFDPNVLPVGTGLAEATQHANDFVKAVALIHQRFPHCHISGGISNVSFAFRGMQAVREAMHSSFLYHACQAGLDICIVNAGMLGHYEHIEPQLLSKVEDVLYHRQENATEALLQFVAEHREATEAKPAKGAAPEDLWRDLRPEQRVIQALVKGVTDSLEQDMNMLIPQYEKPVHIIEGPLMQAMNQVGALFSEGKMFLPQVVKSARVMKRAVTLLQPYLEASQGDAPHQACILLATVKGDVHDIGKNIIALVLSCNGFKVIDLGVMVPCETILAKLVEHQADIVALSGLITPSLEEMAQVAAALQAAGHQQPLLVGGATTSALHTALKLAPQYSSGLVLHTADASSIVPVALALTGSQQEAYQASCLQDQEALRQNYQQWQHKSPALLSLEQARAQSLKTDWENVPSQRPARKGVIRCSSEGGADITLSWADMEKYLDWSILLRFYELQDVWNPLQQAFHPDAPADKRAEAELLMRDARDLWARAQREKRLELRALFGIFPAYAQQDDIVIEGADFVFHSLRQQKPSAKARLALADFVAPQGKGGYMGAMQLSLRGVDDWRIEMDEYTALLLPALANMLVEAAAECLSLHIQELWGQGDASIIRPACGFPTQPDHAEKETILSLLAAREYTGVQLTETYMMQPQASICSLLFKHPQAQYFAVGSIAEDQRADYMRRTGRSSLQF